MGTNTKLVEYLVNSGIIRNQRVRKVMELVDRGDFVDDRAYEDRPQAIGCGATISAPHMHAIALEWLEPKLKQGARVLDVGSGSGYLTACLGYLVDVTAKSGAGEAWGIDADPMLVQKSKENLAKNHKHLLASPNFGLIVGNAWVSEEIGDTVCHIENQSSCQSTDSSIWNKKFDVIHVGAAASRVPETLWQLLEVGGVMLIPIGPSESELPSFGAQKLQLVRKLADGRSSHQNLLDVLFVPLRHPDSAMTIMIFVQLVQYQYQVQLSK